MSKLYAFEPVNDHIDAIRTPTGEILYLIKGSETSLLIDTSSGLGNLKEEVQTHTDKPLLVALTHGHIDHASGVSAFEKVYMNELDLPVYQQNSEDIRQDYISMNFPEWNSRDDLFLAPLNPDYSFLPLENGQIFDLGNLHVSAWSLPGHTPGSMVFLIEEDGILITGDAANTNTFLFMDEASSVEAYLQALKQVLHQLQGRYHRVFLSHRDVDSGAAMLEEGIQVCQDVLNGKTAALPFTFLGYEGHMAKACNRDLTLNDGTYFNMVYNPAKVREK